ncbi:hypothetical protein TYRP_012795 [Tyrophagus putrescentiae]|nr:hypothetical protein TYRP_012795 [Tyrophagus putrescentiae]
MKLFLATLSIAFCLTGKIVLAEDAALARVTCSRLHPGVVIDRTSNDTAYFNSHCLLNCAIGGRFCHSGACQPAPPTGYLDVQIESASVAGVSSHSNSNLQVTACLQNQTSVSAQTPLPLPEHASCVSCATSVVAVTEGGFAYWNQVCSGGGASSGHLFNELATVTFELWATVGPFQEAKHFIGGASVSVPEMSREQSSGRLLHLPLRAGHLAGQVTVRVTWTPKE